MDVTSALQELEQLAGKVGVDVVYDRLSGEGAGMGGLCKVKGRYRTIIEKRGSVGERLSVLARALLPFDLEAHFVSPAVREYLEQMRKQQSSRAVIPSTSAVSEPAADPSTAVAVTPDPESAAAPPDETQAIAD